MILSRKSLPFWPCFLLGLGFLLLGQQLFALDPSRTVFQYNLQSWNRQNGLPFNRIRAITQTPDGYLWMATQNGLVRFDGADFARTAIPSHFGWHVQSVDTMTLSPRGGFWFGLDGGGFGYFDGTNHFDTLTVNGLSPQMKVHSVQEQSDRSIWIAGATGITGWLGGNTNQLISNDQITDIWATYEDSQHRLWLGTVEKGLYYLEAGKVKQFPDTALVGNPIRAIVTDQQGRLWVGTSAGLRSYDRAFKRDESLTDYTEVQTLLADKHGAVWAGTTGGGLVRFYNGEISHLRKTNGLAEDYVTSLFEDREGSLWVGTRNGLTQISDLKFPAGSTKDGLLSEPVHGVCAASNGGVWCATSSGIYNYHDRTVFSISAPTTGGFYIKRVVESHDGDLYALNGHREIQIFSGGNLVTNFSTGEWPVAIAEDSHGVIVSMGGQLYRVSRTALTPFAFAGTPPQFGWIRNLFTCADGSLLVASVNGVFRIYSDHVENWALGEGLLDRDVSCVTEDSEGTIWIGHANGLSRLKNHKVTVVHGGLPEATLYALVPDNLGGLWINSTAGIIGASRRSLNDCADGKSSQSRLHALRRH